MVSDTRCRFGLYGKIPSLGDFVRSNVSESFVGPWDRWLQEGIAESKPHLGAAWQNAYMSAPIWRFTLSAGLAGANAILGVMMPSVDRVGRQFPLALLSPCPNSQSPFLDHFQSTSLFHALEEIALDALEDDSDRVRVQERLAKLPPVASSQKTTCAASQGTLVVRNSTDFRADLAAHLATPKFRSPSIWSCEIDGSEHMMTCEGMPRSGQMAGLFDLRAPVWSAFDQVPL